MRWLSPEHSLDVSVELAFQFPFIPGLSLLRKGCECIRNGIVRWRNSIGTVSEYRTHWSLLLYDGIKFSNASNRASSEATFAFSA